MFFQDYCQTWRKTCKKTETGGGQITWNQSRRDWRWHCFGRYNRVIWRSSKNTPRPQWKVEEKNRERRSKSRRHAKKVSRDHWWNNEIKIGWKWWKTIKMQKYRLWNTEVFTGENRVRNCNMVARDWINKGRTYKQIRRSEKSNAL